VVDCTGLENRQRGNTFEGSNPSPSAQIFSNFQADSPHNAVEGKGTERTQKHPEGTVRMQTGCKQNGVAHPPNGVPKLLLAAWPNVPEHIRLAIIALIEPYRDTSAPGTI
jgi:hypothetical protein